MIYSLASSTGWSIEYIMTLSPQQLALFGEASKQIHKREDKDTKNIHDMSQAEIEAQFKDFFTAK